MHLPCDNLSMGTKIFDPVTLTLEFDLLLKFYYWHSVLNQKRCGFHISHVHSLWQYLSYCIMNCDLDLEVLPSLKNFNLGNSFLTKRQGLAETSHVPSLWQYFSCYTMICDLVTLTLKFDLLTKNFNLNWQSIASLPEEEEQSYVLSLW